MKKLYSILSLLAISAASHAQVVPGADMESWRTGSSSGGLGPAVTIHAPYAWHGLDSLIIYDGELAALAGIGTGHYAAQIFQENTITHGGAHSAKLLTLKQDTLGIIGGSLANYNTSFDLSSFTYSFWGGLKVTERMHSVSAWIRYSYPGATPDTGILNVQAIQDIGGYDSVIGSGSVDITATGVWQQVSAILTYVDGTSIPDTIRITFSSSKGGNTDSSVLYVDDVTMMNAVGVEKTIMTNELVDIYPNPAANVLNIACNTASVLRFDLFAVSGQKVASKAVSGNSNIDISSLPSGLYFYNVSDKDANILQKGKVSVIH